LNAMQYSCFRIGVMWSLGLGSLIKQVCGTKDKGFSVQCNVM